MANAWNALIGWPIYSDVGVRLTPTFAGGSWRASLPLSNLQARDLYKVARSTDATASSTRFRVDLGEAKQVRTLGLLYRSPDRTGAPSTAARVRYLGISTSAQGVLFDYEAGDDLTALGGTFTRTGNATYIDSGGVLRTAATGVPRDSHYIGGVRHLLLEMARTNLVIQSENFGTTWSAFGTPTRSAAAHTASGVSLDLIGDDAAGAVEGYLEPITFTGNAAKSLSCFVKKSTATSTALLLRDTTAGANRLLAVITWSGTVPSVAMTTGTYLGMVPLADGVYRLLFRTTTVTAANTNEWSVYAASDSALSVGGTGTIYIGGMQAEDATTPSSYIKTTTATVTRNADSLSFAFTTPPAAMTMYAKVVERGSAELSTGAGVSYIGSAATGDPDFYIGSNGSGVYRAVDFNVMSAAAASPAYGDTVELRAVLNADGSVALGQSINAAAEVVAATSGTHSFGSAWSGNFLYINSIGSGNVGLGAFQAVRVVSGVQSLASMRSAVYDSGWLTPFPVGRTSDDTEGVNLLALAFPASTLPLMRYVYVDIDDATNAAGYIDLNRFVVTGAIQPGTNISVGATIGLETGTTAEDSDGSVTTYVRRPTRRSTTCVFEEQPDADAFALFDFQRIANLDRQFLWSFDPSDTTNQWRHTFLATLRTLSKFEANIGNRWGIPHEIREVL